MSLDKLKLQDWTEFYEAYPQLSAKAFNEYIRFLSLKIDENDYKLSTLKLSPSYRIDNIWHKHQLIPQHYLKICMNVGGYMIEHSPVTKKRKNIGIRYNNTWNAYKNKFGKPNNKYWPKPIKIETNTPNYKEEKKSKQITIEIQRPLITIRTLGTIKISIGHSTNYLAKKVSHMYGEPYEKINLVYNARLIEINKHKKIADYFDKDSTIIALPKLIGC